MKLIVDKDKHGFETKEFKEYLKTPCLKTEITQQEADELKQTLIDALAKYGGLGISATQIGIKKRACLIKFGDEELFLVNPLIVEKSKESKHQNKAHMPRINPASPIRFTTKALRAALLARAFSYQKPIKRYEDKPTPSHPTNSCAIFGEETKSNIINVNKLR